MHTQTQTYTDRDAHTGQLTQKEVITYQSNDYTKFLLGLPTEIWVRGYLQETL